MAPSKKARQAPSAGTKRKQDEALTTTVTKKSRPAPDPALVPVAQSQTTVVPIVELATNRAKNTAAIIIDSDAEEAGPGSRANKSNGDTSEVEEVDEAINLDDELGESPVGPVMWIVSDVRAEHLRKDWTAPVYAFYWAIPDIGYEDGHHFHSFRCAACGCTKVVHRFLDKGDKKSTRNLLKHARTCWGAETVEKAQTMTADEVCEGITQLVDGSITTHFERRCREKITYSHRPHTKVETRYVVLPTNRTQSQRYVQKDFSGYFEEGSAHMKYNVKCS
jgi:hypothetical protein